MFLDFMPLLEAPMPVKIHVAMVVPAAFVGAAQLAMPKGTRIHKTFGYVFMVLMTITAIDAFFVRGLNGTALSWIHLLIPLTLIGIASGLWAIRNGNVKGHRVAMLSLYFGAIGIAGLLTFIPGRIMYRIFFEP